MHLYYVVSTFFIVSMSMGLYFLFSNIFTLNYISEIISEVSFFIKEFIYILNLRHLVWFIYMCVVYNLVKLPIYDYMYVNITNITFFILNLKLLVSFLISIIFNRLFDIIYPIQYELLEMYLVDIVYNLHKPLLYNNTVYMGGIVSHIIMPEVKNAMKRRSLQKRMTYLLGQQTEIEHRMKTFEIISNVLDRDRSHPWHGGLADAFRSHIDTCKNDMANIRNEISSIGISFSLPI